MRKLLVALIALGLAVGLFGAPALAASDTTSATFFIPATAGGGSDVQSGTPWFDTGLRLKPGTMVTIRASGLWKDCPDPTCGTTPAGVPMRYSEGCVFIAPEFPAGGLIARMDQKPPVFVGNGPTAINGRGKLTFAINDCYFGDNTGGFTVTVTYPTDSILVNADADTAE